MAKGFTTMIDYYVYVYICSAVSPLDVVCDLETLDTFIFSKIRKMLSHTDFKFL